MFGFYRFIEACKRFAISAFWVALLLFLWASVITKCHAQNVPLIRVQHDSFVSYYDQQLKNPALLCYILEWPHFSGSYRVKGRHFKADTKLPRPRLLDKHYTGSGYVRGHLCSAADRDSDKAWLKETYLTSNLVPMTMICNSGAWKVIEDSCRALAIAGHRLVIARGPLYERYPEVTAGRNTSSLDLTIPDGFFCAAKCLDCNLHYFDFCQNAGTSFAERVLHFQADQRVSVLLQNIIGLWSREEYETITH